MIHSCHRCTKLIALRKQIDTQLQHFRVKDVKDYIN